MLHLHNETWRLLQIYVLDDIVIRFYVGTGEALV